LCTFKTPPSLIKAAASRAGRLETSVLAKTLQQKNKATVLEAFGTLFNKRDYAAAGKFWSPHYIQHSVVIAPGREGLFDLAKSFPPELRWEPGVIMAEGDLVMVHSRYSGRGVATNLIGVDILKMKEGVFVEHWDVLPDEVSKADSKSGLPMFGIEFSY
jgi:predicted SnoaL-like aldol condensation-catalyzing enzyme